jgi:hypothetical protein
MISAPLGRLGSSYRTLLLRSSKSSRSRSCFSSTQTKTVPISDDTDGTSSSYKTRSSTSTNHTQQKKSRLVIAVGGNALQRRGERLTIENMLKAAADVAPTLVSLCAEYEVVLTHGNGPQVGELALERSAATFDVLVAESVGQIGYVLAQAMASVGLIAVPIVTQVVVDPQSAAFRNPYVLVLFVGFAWNTYV